MNIERIGISVSILGATIMAIFGLIMAYITKSDAILLDGCLICLMQSFKSIRTIIVTE